MIGNCKTHGDGGGERETICVGHAETTMMLNDLSHHKATCKLWSAMISHVPNGLGA